MIQAESHPPLYYVQETLLILGFAYLILAGGGITSLINYRVQTANAVLASAVLGGWLMVRLIRGRRIPRCGFDLGVVLFLGALTLATVYSIDVRRSLSALSVYLTYALVFYFWLDMLHSGLPVELVEKTWLVAVGIVVTFSLLDAVNSLTAWRELTHGGTLPFAPPFTFRSYTLLGDANLGAAVINLVIPLALARAIVGRRFARLGWGAYAALALLAVYFTSSRGGWLGTAAALLALAVLTLIEARRTAGAASRLARMWRFVATQLQRLWQRPALAAAVGLLVLGLAGGGGLLLLGRVGGPTHGPLLESRTGFWRSAWLAFASDPLTGTGPGTYPSAFTRYGGVPPDRPYPHAHSFPFTLLAEAGLNGGVGLIVILTMAVGTRLRWHSSPPVAAPGSVAQASVAGPLAALVGLSVHSLFDNHLLFGSVAVPAAAFVACLYCRPPVARPAAPVSHRPGGLSPWALLVPGLAAAGVTFYSLRAIPPSLRAAQAAQRGDWSVAAADFDEAARLDPHFAFYQFQAGFSYGMLASGGDMAALDTAISRYEAALRLEPAYSLNSANLGALYLQAGRPDDARVVFRQSITLAGQPGSWLYWLNYGHATEQAGLRPDAKEAYLNAIRLRPDIAEAPLWQTSEVRRGVLSAWQRETSGTSTVSALDQGFAFLDQGDLASAQAAFEQAWRDDPVSAGVYRGLALAAERRGDMPLADSYFAAAISLTSLENESKVWPLVDWAALAARNGQPDVARQRYEAAFAAVSDASVYGWGAQGFSPYGWFVFNREGLSQDLLPQLIRADVTPELAASFLPLGELREIGGDTAGAAALYRRLLEFDPGLSEAQARLATLGGR